MDHPVTPLSRLFAHATDLRMLARVLGEVCLAEMQEIDELRGAAGPLATATRALEEEIVDLGLRPWHAVQPGSGFQKILAEPLVAAELAKLEGHQPLACVAALRAVCRVPLNDFYIQTSDRIELERGDPVPVALRPTHKAFAGSTPHYATLDLGSLLAGTAFRLYGGPVNVPVRMSLDFRARDSLDAAAWLGTERDGSFPIIASVHPYATDADLAIDHVDPATFFGVRPIAWNPQAVLAQLRTVRDAGIAVMPELSLPDPAALAASIGAAHQDLPAIVVAGSAHHDAGAGTRVNAGEAYLHGARLLSYRKVHPFGANYLGPNHSRRSRMEDLAGPRSITIAAGRLTRLAVVICADLNDVEVPSLLEQVGVNLLLVPSLTVGAGAFVGTCAQLASRQQAVTVIVNGTAAIDPSAPPPSAPFLAMVAVPVPSSSSQVTEHGPPPTGRRAVGRIDVQAKPPPDVCWS
jgi:hypothetical protein